MFIERDKAKKFIESATQFRNDYLQKAYKTDSLRVPASKKMIGREDASRLSIQYFN